MKGLMIAGLMTLTVVLPFLLRGKREQLWDCQPKPTLETLRYDTSEFLDTL